MVRLRQIFQIMKCPKKICNYTYIACRTIDPVMKMGKKLISFLFIRLWVLTDMLDNKKLQSA